MKILGNSFLTKAVLLLCVLMQAVALTPHHHHGNGGSVCLNYTHLYEADVCGDVCADTGEHNGQPYAVCQSHTMTVAQPQERDEVVVEVSEHHDHDCGCATCIGDAAEAAVEHMAAITINGIGEYNDSTNSYIREYFTAALPCRAPDFMC